jgi:hypothetical protein
MNQVEKDYIGDVIYAVCDGLILTTENGISFQNIIVFEQQQVKALLRFLSRCGMETT